MFRKRENSFVDTAIQSESLSMGTNYMVCGVCENPVMFSLIISCAFFCN